MKSKIMIMSLVMAMGISAPAFAQGFGEYKWHDKIARGAVNAVTSPVEIIRGIDLTTKSSNVAKGWTVGLVKGVAGTVLRLGTGVVDVVTFPLDWPNENKAPLMEPKYAWQDWNGDYLE